MYIFKSKQQVFVQLTPSHWHFTLHFQLYMCVYSVWYFCFWQKFEYCITGVPVWVHVERESVGPSKVTGLPVAGQAVSGNGNLRSCCLLPVSRLSTKLFLSTSPAAPCGLSLSLSPIASSFTVSLHKTHPERSYRKRRCVMFLAEANWLKGEKRRTRMTESC